MLVGGTSLAQLMPAPTTALAIKPLRALVSVRIPPNLPPASTRSLGHLSRAGMPQFRNGGALFDRGRSGAMARDRYSPPAPDCHLWGISPTANSPPQAFLTQSHSSYFGKAIYNYTAKIDNFCDFESPLGDRIRQSAFVNIRMQMQFSCCTKYPGISYHKEAISQSMPSCPNCG